MKFYLPVAVLALVFGVLTRVGIHGPEMHFAGFAKLEWESSDHCLIDTSDFKDNPQLTRITTDAPTGGRNIAHCVSKWIPVQGQYLEFEYAGYRAKQDINSLLVQVETSGGEFLRSVVLPFQQKYQKLHLSHRLVPDTKRNHSVRIHLIDKDPGRSWMSLRNKLGFYKTSGISLFFGNLLQNKIILKLFTAATVLLILLSSVLYLRSDRSSSIVTILFFAVISGSIHFEPNLFFYGDDVMFISHYLEQGVAGLVRSHNEHFLPVFFGLFILEYLTFFGDYDLYLLLSLLIQGVNGFLLLKFFEYLSPNLKQSKLAALLVTLWFCLSSLHVEALQWATCQSILLAVTFRLAGYISALRYLESHKSRHLMLSIVLVLCGMFCYGGGILIPLEVMLLPLLVRNPTFGYFRACSRYEFRLWVSMAASFATGGILYFLFRNGIGSSVTQIERPIFRDYLVFSLLGSQYGTLVRGLGLEKILQFLEVNSIFPRQLEFLAKLYLIPIVVGLTFNLISLWLLTRRALGKRGLILWLLAQILITCHFFLIGLGRTDWVGGPRYSLTPRYHTESVLGMALLLMPIVALACEKIQLMTIARRKVSLSIIFCLLATFVWRQLSVSSNFNFYRDRALSNQRYIEQLVQWFAVLGPESNSIYAQGHDLAGLYPVYHTRERTWDTVPSHDPKALCKMFDKSCALTDRTNIKNGLLVSSQ